MNSFLSLPKHSVVFGKAFTSLVLGMFCLFSLSSFANASTSPWASLNNIDIPSTLPQSVLHQQEHLSAVTYQISDLYVNLSDVIYDLKVNQEKPTITFIVADVVEISNNFILNLNNQSIYIFARKIIGEGSGTIFVKNSNDGLGRVGVFADEVSARLKVAAVFPGVGVDFTSVGASSAEKGTIVFSSASDNKLVELSVNLNGIMDMIPQLLSGFFEKTFDLAASIYHQNPSLSFSLLTWTEEALRALPVFREQDPFLENLYLQTANLKQFFDLALLSPGYVPELDANLYQYTYLGYLDAMEAYRVQYDRFVDRGLDINARYDAAILMQANLQDAVNAESLTIQRSEQQINSFRSTLSELKVQFLEQEFLVNEARIDFEIGISIYKQQQEIELALGVIETITSAATSLASRDPAAIADFAASIPSTASDLQSIQEKIDGIADLLERVEEISDAVDGLNSDVQEGINQQDIANALESMELTVPSLSEANNTWEVLLVEISHELNLAVEEGIGGSNEFLIALETLIVYGKSITATQISMMQELSRLIDLKITSEVNSRHFDRISELVDQLATSESANLELETIFFRSLNALKRPMFVALTKFSAAFEYWSLTPSTVIPSLNKTYEQYRLDLAFLQEQYNEALNNFQPRPQDFNVTNVVVDDPALIYDFQTDGELSLQIGLDHPNFTNFQRVRLNRIRVILEGENLALGESYFIDIESNGEYQDRFNDHGFLFNSERLFRLFGYELLDGESGSYHVITDGAVADDFKFAYFEPTPFSTWSFSLRQAEHYDLSQVERIRIEFSGNAIPVF